MINNIHKIYNQITNLLIEKGITVTTMESCTSGLISSLITDTEGASAIFKGAYIVYSNDAKIMNGVNACVIDKYGVYSEETATAMALACKDKYKSDIGIGITGTFGNVDPSNNDSVPGEVYYSIVIYDEVFSAKIQLMSSNGRLESIFESFMSSNGRLKSKLEVASVVGQKLLSIIQGG